MDFGLSGCAVIITGSSRGTGKTIACGLTKEVARTAMSARYEERLRKAAKENTNLTAFLPLGE